MSEAATATKSAVSAANKAADKAVRAADSAAASAARVVDATLPTVVDTVELGMEIPSRVVLNQKLVVGVSVLTGVALGAVGYWGVKKFLNRNKAVLVTPAVDVEVPESTSTH